MRNFFVLVLVTVCLMACKPKNGQQAFDALIKSELATGKQVDTCLFDVRFGMSSKEFYNYCWSMNKKGLFTDGNDPRGNMYILFKEKEGLKWPAAFNFFPEFKNDRITEIKGYYQYEGWAPWNKQLASDSLLAEVLSLYKKRYAKGNPFMEIAGDNKPVQYAKVDGNRQIIISKYDEAQVKVVFSDLRAISNKQN